MDPSAEQDLEDLEVSREVKEYKEFLEPKVSQVFLLPNVHRALRVRRERQVCLVSQAPQGHTVRMDLVDERVKQVRRERKAILEDLDNLGSR